MSDERRFYEAPAEGTRRSAPAALRNRDPIADVMISGLRAAATLKDDNLKPSVTTLSQQDRSMKVRQAALEALKVMG